MKNKYKPTISFTSIRGNIIEYGMSYYLSNLYYNIIRINNKYLSFSIFKLILKPYILVNYKDNFINDYVSINKEINRINYRIQCLKDDNKICIKLFKYFITINTSKNDILDKNRIVKIANNLKLE